MLLFWIFLVNMNGCKAIAKSTTILVLCGLVLVIPLSACKQSIEAIANLDRSSSFEMIPRINGYIKGQFETGSKFMGWHLFLVQKVSNKGYLGKVGQNGSFEFFDVEKSGPYTIYLLNPDFQVSAGLALPINSAKLVGQYFFPKAGRQPLLILQGQNMAFQDIEGIAIDLQHLVKDTNSNGIADGFDSLWQLSSTKDEDYLIDHFDSDQDGLVNQFDVDDDNDGSKDFNDKDSNENGIDDVSEQTHDEHLLGDVSFITTTLQRSINIDGLTSDFLYLGVEMRPEFDVDQVKMVGPLSVLDGAEVQYISDAGEIDQKPWDGSMFDDGIHFDRSSQDNFFASKLAIQAKQPRRNQAVFVKYSINYEDRDRNGKAIKKTRSAFYGKVLDHLLFADFSVSLSSDYTPEILSTPFFELDDYSWSYRVFDENQMVVYQSKAIKSGEAAPSVPIEALPADTLLYLQATASTLQRSLGHGSHVIQAPPIVVDISTAP